MLSFIISIAVLVLGYFFYGRVVERIIGPDDRITPAVAKNDGVDFMVLPNWKIFMIQFLNIAGTGPIFGAIMGAKFGPSSCLWIVSGCGFAGAVHDYLSGMLSMRNDGAGLPELIGKYLGKTTRTLMLVFATLLLVIVGAVFVYSPAQILHGLWGSELMWIIIIFAYYLIATMMPIDKIIGRIYPLFAVSLLFMAAALMVVLIIKMPDLPELWDGVDNLGATLYPSSFTDTIFPSLFITVACGAISGFHATQSPLMARCLKSEKMGRPIFYGAMITEGVVALIWAAVGSYFFYAEPTPGYNVLAGAQETGFMTSAPSVVNIVCKDWLGVVGGILALLGVVAAPITSGDTALRSARLIIADFFHIKQKSISKRLMISIPLFAVSLLILLWQIGNPDGFNVIWQYFGWSNQTLSVFTLWMLTVFLAKSKKPFIITLIPAVFMTTVCVTFIVASKQAFGLSGQWVYISAAAVVLVSLTWFTLWYRKDQKEIKEDFNESHK